MRANASAPDKTFPLKSKHYIQISLSLSCLSIAITLFINMLIAREFIRSTGKTRALFGMKEVYQFGYQYYVVIPGLISLIIALLSLRKSGWQRKVIFTIILSLAATGIVFMRIWRLFV
jgi:ABC-type glycerol-3-phosphate transport system permease component